MDQNEALIHVSITEALLLAVFVAGETRISFSNEKIDSFSMTVHL